MFLINHILQEGDEVALFVPSNLHHFIGHYRKSGISGKWTVVDTEGWSDYEEGVIFNFKSNGKLVFEAPAGTPDDLKGLYEMMNLLQTKYTVSGDKIVLSMEFFGEKDESEMRFTLEGDTLTLYDGDDITVLKRSK